LAQAQPDLDFYARLLGLRLVKRTVNFDNRFVYHFYYGDELGRPSMVMTTFPYHGWAVPPGIRGAGQVTVTRFSVPSASLPFWLERLESNGVATRASSAPTAR
jgi:glyoxalase family protein